MTMWRPIPGSRSVVYWQIAVRLIDDFTAAPPIGRVDLDLDLQVGGQWFPLSWRVDQYQFGIRPVSTASGVWAFPDIGRTRAAAGQPPDRYRLRILPELYRPAYRVNQDGLEFELAPYDDTAPPPTLPSAPGEVPLYPAQHYPFPPHVRVLRGLIQTSAGQALADAQVSSTTANTLTDESGSFSLPLRWARDGVPLDIDAAYVRGGEDLTGSITVTLPDALGRAHVIELR